MIEVGNLYVTGLINQCDLNQLAANSVPRKQDLTFDLIGVYNIPRLIINGNLHMASSVNQQSNFIPNIISIDDSRPIQVPISFVDDIVVHEIYLNNLVNKQNLTFILNDAVFNHINQRITGRKYFRKPVKIFGHILQAQYNPGRLYVNGLINKYNLTNLFATTVTTNSQNTQIIRGNKFFTGKITFSNLGLKHGLNGLHVPQDLVLVHTNEKILGETRFMKNVHVHRDLNARLINNINLTQFVQNSVNIHHLKGDEVFSSITFVNPIVIHNLTVYQSINDIPVNQLIHRNIFNADIDGRKSFRSPIHISGQLTATLVNGIDIERDIGNEMIDLRESANVNSTLTGSIIFDDEVYFDNMNIHEKINNIHVKQVTQDHIESLENYLKESNKTIHQSITNLNRTERSLDYQFSTYHLSGN